VNPIRSLPNRHPRLPPRRFRPRRRSTPTPSRRHCWRECGRRLRLRRKHKRVIVHSSTSCLHQGLYLGSLLTSRSSSWFSSHIKVFILVFLSLHLGLYQGSPYIKVFILVLLTSWLHQGSSYIKVTISVLLTSWLHQGSSYIKVTILVLPSLHLGIHQGSSVKYFFPSLHLSPSRCFVSKHVVSIKKS
jgi:hypothetical protein